MTVVPIPTSRITDWRTFHDVFAETLGFPGYYGRNGNAWIDCMTYVDEPDLGMTRIAVGEGDVLTLQLGEVADFAARCPEQYAALIDWTAFVNYRRLELGERSILALSFWMR